MSLSVNGAFALLHSSLVIGGASVEGITKFDYKVKQEKKNNYGAGPKVYSRSRGRKEYEGTISMYYREMRNIKASAGVSDLCEVPPFDPIFMVGSADGDMVKNVFKDMEFLEESASFENTSDDTIVDCPVIFSEKIESV